MVGGDLKILSLWSVAGIGGGKASGASEVSYVEGSGLAACFHFIPLL